MILESIVSVEEIKKKYKPNPIIYRLEYLYFIEHRLCIVYSRYLRHLKDGQDAIYYRHIE